LAALPRPAWSAVPAMAPTLAAAAMALFAGGDCRNVRLAARELFGLALVEGRDDGLLAEGPASRAATNRGVTRELSNQRNMHGTIPVKIGRVVGNLITHPQYLGRCLAHNLRNGKTPLDLELPWFSYAAIDFLETFVRPNHAVCEFGSGGSTLFFARRARSVYAIEDNATWHELVAQRLQALGLRNATLKLCPFNFKEPAGFADSDYLNGIPPGQFDIIVVDGSEEWTPVRPACFEKAEERIGPGGIIVVDDSWRYPQIRQKHHARNHQVFQSVGPCRPGVTSTDVFFY